MKQLPISLLTVLACSPLHGQVTINEINAAPNERALRWDAGGQPRLGSGQAWFDSAITPNPVRRPFGARQMAGWGAVRWLAPPSDFRRPSGPGLRF